MNMYDYWLENIDEKDELMRLTDNERKEAFYKDLDFGTGGMRGIMGLGPNRINKYTIRHATQGLADEIKSHGQFYKDKGVVIAYDSRNHSYEFAQETAAVLCGNGIKTYLFESLRPTPELSFAVRHLGCARGVVITASHNPKEYNGYKIYGEDGGQLPPKDTDVIDYLQGINGLPCSNVIKFVLDNGWIVVRPSGTEPKIKIYIEIQGMDIEDTEKKLLRVKKAFLPYKKLLLPHQFLSGCKRTRSVLELPKAILCSKNTSKGNKRI